MKVPLLMITRQKRAKEESLIMMGLIMKANGKIT
jgi:hypothetical protein